jgi:ABC-2 type transport system ATP-binding protein
VIGARPLSIEVSRIYKSFRMPLRRVETLKERAVHPLRREEHGELRVLEDISFQVREGEFFGIVGRNGSGKSTLLKLMASVYKPDSGKIRVAGVLAPIIELGVGFQPELSARDNVILNSLMMGLTPKEARRRFDAVIEFAELQDFVNLKLKNYSSGMRVRLAFAIMMQTDPDVMLLDEVLAVGDSPFQQRCKAAFEDFKRQGSKTVILVTHAIPNVKAYCDRAMLLEAGRIERIGDPNEVGERYMDLNPLSAPSERKVPRRDRAPVRIEDLRLIGPGDREVHTVEAGEPLMIRATVRAIDRVTAPRLLLEITSQDGERIFVPPPVDLGAPAASLRSGAPIGITGRVENKFPAGRYAFTCAVAVGPPGEAAAVSEASRYEFDVAPSGRADAGLISLDYEVRLDAPSNGAGAEQ